MISVNKKDLIVIKIGTNVLTNSDNKLNLNNLRHLVSQISFLIKNNKKVVLVSSGSIICGSEKLEITPKELVDKQAAAAVGQVILMENYQNFFLREGIDVAQILLTKDTFLNKDRSKHAKNTFLRLLDLGVVPIVNENDTVSIDEIKFSDNDNLSGMVSVLLKADLQIILTDIDGVYDMDPKTNESAKLIETLNEISDKMINDVGTNKSSKGVGGMRTKLEAAKYLLDHNIEVIIANGLRENIIIDLYSECASATFCSVN